MPLSPLAPSFVSPPPPSVPAAIPEPGAAPLIPPALTASLSQEVMSHLLHQLAFWVKASITPVPIELWRDEVNERYRSPRYARSTRYRMRQALAEAVDLAGPGATTAALTAELVERMAARIGAAATTNGLLRALRAACNLGVAKGYLPCSPFGRETPWVDSDDFGRRRHHSRGEIAAVLRSLEADATSWEGHRLLALASVYAYTGLRLNEALCLKPSDVDFTRSVIFVRARRRRLKTKASAAPVPMPGPLIAILRAWLPRCGADWVFPGVKSQKPWTGGTTGRTARARLVAAGRSVGVEKFTPQSLRRSLATHLVGHQGLSREQLRLVLRHTEVETAKHYLCDDVCNLAKLVKGFDYASA